MTVRGEQVNRAYLSKIAVPVAICIATGAFSFALGTVRASRSGRRKSRTSGRIFRSSAPCWTRNQVVTKDQLAEIVRRLDERTVEIIQDVQYFRQREERRDR